MFGLLGLGFLSLLAIGLFGLCAAVVSLVLWVVLMPFRLIGFLFKGLGFVLALPFLALFAVLGVVIFGVGALIFFVPVVPFALLAFLLWRWMRGRPRATVSA